MCAWRAPEMAGALWRAPGMARAGEAAMGPRSQRGQQEGDSSRGIKEATSCQTFRVRLSAPLNERRAFGKCLRAWFLMLCVDVTMGDGAPVL